MLINDGAWLYSHQPRLFSRPRCRQEIRPDPSRVSSTTQSQEQPDSEQSYAVVAVGAGGVMRGHLKLLRRQTAVIIEKMLGPGRRNTH